MPKLFIVPTPIGNLNDMTFRAIDVLRKVDFILAEDTRTTGIILKHFQIENRLQAYHKFNEHKQTQAVVKQIESVESAALVSDAGTPGISDPGFMLVRACVGVNIPVETLPGATAFVPALLNSGFPMTSFCFEGFLPPKKGRKKKLQLLAEEVRTIILYESPYRLLKTLEQIREYFGEERELSVSKEISKIHEETLRGTPTELIGLFTKEKLKGEFVIVIHGAEK